MKNKKLIGAIAGICALILVVVLVAVRNRPNQGEDSPPSGDVSGAASSQVEGEDPSSGSQAGASSEPGGNENPTPTPTPTPTPAPTPGPEKPGGTVQPNKPTPQPGGTNAGITFPYAIPNSNLVIRKVGSYDGIYLEDGSDTKVTGVAAVILENKGKTAVEYVDLTLRCGDAALNFKASGLGAGQCVVVQEANKVAAVSGTYSDCEASVAEIDKLEMSADRVKVEENPDGSLAVTNLTGKNIPCVRVFYKFYMPEETAYVGGITYTAKLTDLGPNQTQNVMPSHYSAGNSKVVMVRTYDVKE